MISLLKEVYFNYNLDIQYFCLYIYIYFTSLHKMELTADNRLVHNDDSFVFLPNQPDPSATKKKILSRQTRSKIKKKFIEWSISSTSHGYPHIFRNSRTSIKILWTICFIISAGLCAFMVYKSIMDYLKFDVVTKVKLIFWWNFEY